MGIWDGIVGDIAGDFLGGLFAEERANAQNIAQHGMMKRQEDFQREMRSTAYQAAVGDMKAAGLNPMLAYHQGPAATPAGAGGSAAQAVQPKMKTGSASMQTAAQTELLQAETDKARAEAKEIEARTPVHGATVREIEARIPRHQADVRHIEQQIAESAVRIENIWEDTKVKGASAANIEQQTKNLKETVPLIQQQIRHLRALTDKDSAAGDEIKQRVKANLPELERILKGLQGDAARLAQPGRAADAAAADSFIGQLGAYLRAINPLKGFINATPRGD